MVVKLECYQYDWFIATSPNIYYFMKLLGKVLLPLCFVFIFSACGEDEDATKKCLECTSSNPDITLNGGDNVKVCEGDTDDEGNEVTLSDLEAAKALFEGFGDDVDCSL